MECSKTQCLLDGFSEGRLPEALSREVRRHLDECTDCRVAQQRAARLQQLLALKRHERPSLEYFDKFLSEFHQRFLVETRVRATWWERFVASFTIERTQAWSYAIASGVGAVLVASALMLRGMIPVGRLASRAAPQVVNGASAPTLATVSSPAPPFTPSRAIDSDLPRSVEPSSAGSVVIIPAVAHNEGSVPRYVLDRITVTPASYEVASVHF